LTRFIIIANGPFWTRDNILKAIQDRQIVALDGAADKLLAYGIHPHVILGDFDSIQEQAQTYWGVRQTYHTMSDHAQPYQGHHHTTIVPAKNQMLTDLVKGIRYCDQHQAQDISIICATGGREDHHEANKLALQSEYQKQRPIVLHGPFQSLRWAEDETVILKGEVGDHCGFVAREPGYGDSIGLEYPCQHSTHSLCNRLSAEQATLTITGSALIIMPSSW
jgi:thiamine pyrophosphokinase